MKKKHIKARLLFASNLRQLREAKILSQEQLADIAGLHRTYVSSVERGERNVTIDSMEKLAEALDIDLRELLKPQNETSS
jgi:transcriptional regulator with XRE-family HTH domain